MKIDEHFSNHYKAQTHVGIMLNPPNNNWRKHKKKVY